MTALIDKGICFDKEYRQVHESNQYKNYCYDLPFPIEQDRLYKKGKIYTVTIRTIDSRLAKYFYEVCVNQFTEEIKALHQKYEFYPER